jgi:hypothetical protein
MKKRIKASTLVRIEPVSPSMVPHENMPMIRPPFSRTS